MTVKNLWGDLNDLPTLRTPASILKEQAEILQSHTNGMLVAEVKTSGNQNKRIYYELNIVVPALHNYKYNVVAVSHTITLYPVHFHSSVNNIASATDESEFVQKLSDIISSDEIRQNIIALLSQAREGQND